MALYLSPNVSNMTEEDILDELRARLYDLGEARAHSFRSPTSAPYQLSLYGGTGLRTTDIIVKLLDSQLHIIKESPRRREYWTACRDRLLEALRTPWGRCDSNPGSQKCLGGSSGCDTCRYSIQSITRQINTLALGFAGTYAPEVANGEVQGQGNESSQSNNQSSKPGLDDIQNELALTKSKLLEAEEKTKCLEKEKEGAQKELKTLKTELENATKDAINLTENRKQSKKAYDSLANAINKSIKILESDKSNPRIRKEIILKASLEHYDALIKDVTFQLQALPTKHPLDEETTRRVSELEKETIGYQHGRVKALMKLDRHKEAEETAKGVLNSRRKLLGKEAEKTQDILRDYCAVLEKSVKLDEVEWEYLKIWLDSSLKDDKFRDWAGISLALLSQKRDHIDESALWYKKVAIRRLGRFDVNGAAEAALKMVTAQKSFHLSSESVDTLKKTWDKADSNPNDDVLSCGQELGQFYVSVGKYKEAKGVLLAVWKALQKRSGDEYIDRGISVAMTLVSTIGQLPNDDGSDLEELYKSIAESAKIKGDKKTSLQYQHQLGLGRSKGPRNQYQLGCAQLSRSDTVDSEKTLKAAWEEARGPEGLGSKNVLTIQIGWSYGRAILSQSGRDADAMEVFRVLCDSALLPLKAKKDDNRTLAQTIANLAIGRAYAELLLADAEACKIEKEQRPKYKLAKDVLEKVWTEAHQRLDKILESRNLDALTDFLWIGDSYGECQTYLGYPPTAIKVLTEVFELRSKWIQNTSEIETTSDLLKEALEAQAKAKQREMEKEKEKKAAEEAAKAGQKAGQEGSPLSPPGPKLEGLKSPLLAEKVVQPKPKPPKARKQKRVGLIRYFAGSWK
ncbi:hypothetical protein V495_07170 [Pseudogymnoascus sp. VKM F-4514 (FW-929)]|nr:hypothetical protein V495_07170 [Pseudogymnoascus sp. VKM F-4514 (FW-929)]